MNTHEAFQQIADAMNAAIIGQQTVVERLLIAFLADGHVLMEGLPAVARHLAWLARDSVIEFKTKEGTRS